MKRWKTGAVACLMAVCLSVILAGCQSETYTPEGKSPVVSGSALGQQGTLRVGIDASSLPLAGTSSESASGNKRYDGIDVKVAYFLGDELGLDVELVDVGKDPSTALSKGVVDIVLGVDTSVNDVDYWQSSPYIETAVALFGMSSESAIPTVDSKPAIAATISTKSSWRVINLFGDESLVTAEKPAAAFESLNTGTVRYVAVDALAGMYTVDRNGYSNKIVALLQDPTGYCIAIESDNTELQSAITSALSKLTSGGMIDIIEAEFLGESVDLDSYTVIKAPTGKKTGSSSAASASSDEEGDEAEGEDDSESEEASEDEDA